MLIVSIFVFSASWNDERKIKIDCSNTVEFIEKMLPVREVGIKEQRSNNEMPSVSYDGEDYVALLSVPERSIKLPVRSLWNTNYLKKVPCRFFGNPYEGSLVIGGFDAEGQFDFLSELDKDDIITITDMTGSEFSYRVSVVRHSNNAQFDTVIDINYDLTLFVKDREMASWILVRCLLKQ